MNWHSTDIIPQIFIGLIGAVLIITIFSFINFIAFRIVNKEAYKEYEKVIQDIKNKRIPKNNSDFIQYNQELKYISVKSCFAFYFDKNNKRLVESEFYATKPYESYLHSCKEADIFTRLFENNIFNWSK